MILLTITASHYSDADLANPRAFLYDRLFRAMLMHRYNFPDSAPLVSWPRL